MRYDYYFVKYELSDGQEILKNEKVLKSDALGIKETKKYLENYWGNKILEIKKTTKSFYELGQF